MNILTAENITKSYTDKVLLKNVSFYLGDGEKIGILGLNGTGKSTLLKILAKIEVPEVGNVIYARNIVVKMLFQQPNFNNSDTVLQYVLNENKGSDNWNIESDAKSMLTKLGVTNFEQSIEQLSGGQKKRLALVAVLLSDADVLILDEPTNHLDSTMSEWLEDKLTSFKGAVVMVTHDRYFLDSISSRIVEVENGDIFSYETNYSGYLVLKEQRQEMLQASERKRQSILRKEIEWMMRGARARSTKQKAHIQRYEELASKESPAQARSVELSSIATRMGKSTIEIQDLSLAYGDLQLINHFSYTFLRTDRIGVVGENGCGKSSLMKMILGIIEPTAGNINIGQTIKIGYFAQEMKDEKDSNTSSDSMDIMDPDMKVIDYVRSVAEYINTNNGIITASQMLEKFLFVSSEQYKLIGKLSGGEKRRLNLLKVLMSEPNVLILDEPTNDLDITTLTILEDYLDSFAGIVIIVSHDRYFLDRVVTRIIAFEENGVLSQYEGNYTDYIGKAKDASASKSTVGSKEKEGYKSSNDTRGGVKRLKFTYNEQKEFETIEGDIHGLEEKIELVDREIIENSRDFVKLNELTSQKDKLENELNEKMDRWMYLEELADRIEKQ